MIVSAHVFGSSPKMLNDHSLSLHWWRVEWRRPTFSSGPPRGQPKNQPRVEPRDATRLRESVRRSGRRRKLCIIQADEYYDYEASMSRLSRSGPKDGDQRAD